MEIEEFFICPFCGARISMVLDLSAGRQSYIEDCEVCCRPLEIAFEEVRPGEVNLDIEAVEQ